MSKFKAGDVVERTFGCFKDVAFGEVCTVAEADDGGLYLIGKMWRYSNDNFTLVERPSDVTYPNPPHKHAEVIKAWADGAEIEFFNEMSKAWESGVTLYWIESIEYRVKPNNPNADKIAELEATINKAKQQIEELKNG